MKKTILFTSLLALTLSKTSIYADDVQIIDNTKEGSLDEASALLQEMKNNSSNHTAKESVLSKYMKGEISEQEGSMIESGEKSEEEVLKEKDAEIEKSSNDEANKIIEKEKEKAFFKKNKPANAELAEKFAKGEITAGQGLEMERKMKENKMSTSEAKEAILKEEAKREAEALKGEGFIDKIKSFFK